MGQEITGDPRNAPGSAGGSWLTAAALNDALASVGKTETHVVIAALTQEQVREQGGGQTNRQALRFMNQEKALLLNATNQKVLGETLGWNVAAWKGARVALFLVNTQMGLGIRVKVVAVAPVQPAGGQPAAEVAVQPTAAAPAAVQPAVARAAAPTEPVAAPAAVPAVAAPVAPAATPAVAPARTAPGAGATFDPSDEVPF